MNDLYNRVFCPECNAIRICHPWSRYAVCPNGHGKLVPRFTKPQIWQAFAASLPQARRVGRNRFRIDGHDSLFGYRDGSGRRPVKPGASAGPDEVIARHVTPTRQLIRVFARKAHSRAAKSRCDDKS